MHDSMESLDGTVECSPKVCQKSVTKQTSGDCGTPSQAAVSPAGSSQDNEGGILHLRRAPGPNGSFDGSSSRPIPIERRYPTDVVNSATPARATRASFRLEPPITAGSLRRNRMRLGIVGSGFRAQVLAANAIQRQQDLAAEGILTRDFALEPCTCRADGMFYTKREDCAAEVDGSEGLTRADDVVEDAQRGPASSPSG
ncbi:hypothetical protein E4U41_001460 [Claviceps citrina]|nr:hypothetical protein E4U41_001460 [Claviceps citrina]